MPKISEIRLFWEEQNGIAIRGTLFQLAEKS